MSRAPLESPLVRAYRELLGVAPGVSADELKKAYHRLALVYHPDRNPGGDSALDFQRVRAAFEVLSDSGRVRALNENHRRERMLNVVVEGLNLTIGSFFGHRVDRAGTRVDRARRLGTERAGESDLATFGDRPVERDRSILDDPAFDAIEVVYAGKFSVGDEERLRAGPVGAHARQLPWVILNNQGIAHVLDGNFAAALKCFTELDERIPNNIIFTYRRGLCHVILGLTDVRRSLLGGSKPNRAEVERGLKFLRRAVALGQSRTIGKQRCLVIRKTIADVLERLGSRRQAARAWREIARLAPKSVEAARRSGGVIVPRLRARR